MSNKELEAFMGEIGASAANDRIQECSVVIKFNPYDPIMVTNHADYEGAIGLYVYYYPKDDKHYVFLPEKSAGMFLWLDYEQIIRL